MHYWLDEGNGALWLSSAAIVFWIAQYSVLARWWRNAPGARGTRWIGITIVGLAVCLLAVYIPSLLALADPGQFARFASARWYQILAICIVNATALFVITRIGTWEYLRRQRPHDGPMLPAAMARRLAELEAENAELRARQLD